MALTKEVKVDRIEVLENGSVQVRTKTTIVENGKELSSMFHRHVVSPGDDYSNEDSRVQSICSVIYTPEIIAAYQAAQKVNELKA